jgi:hypothetical protein
MTLEKISNQEESNEQIFILVSTYRAKAGEEDAIIALHEDWQRNWASKARVYISWELLRKVEDPGKFIIIAHFESREQVREMEAALTKDAWYARLVSLLEEEPTCCNFTREWQAI